MGQTAAYQAVEGCCRQHVFQDRESNTVKVDLSLLQQQPGWQLAAGSSNGKENTQPPPGPASPASPYSRDCCAPVLDAVAHTQGKIVQQVEATAGRVMPPVTYRSWEAGWLGSPPSKHFAEPLASRSKDHPRSTSDSESVYFMEVGADGMVAPDLKVSSSPAVAPRSTIAQQVAQYSLPDEYTPVLTGLLSVAPPPPATTADETPAASANVSCSPAQWPELPMYETGLGSPSTPTTNPGRSTPGGSPAGRQLGSPLLNSGEQSLTSLQSPQRSPESKNLAMKEAQSLFASMMRAAAPSGKSRGRSAPPSAGQSQNIASADMAAGGAAAEAKKPRKRCSSMEPLEETKASPSGLTPLNGRMPKFPPAELNEWKYDLKKNKFKNRGPWGKE